MTVRVLPLEIIHVDPTINVSRGGAKITELNVRSLAADIEENGQMEPVGVVEIAGASWLSEAQSGLLLSKGFQYVLIYGFRRFAAVSLLNKSSSKDFDTIKASDCGRMTLASAELANVAENWSRDPPTEFDLTIACHRFVVKHKIEPLIVGNRVNKSVSFVLSCVDIVSLVAPDLLDHYKVNCSKENRRKMVELSTIEAPTAKERHEAQRERWTIMQQEEATHRRTDPQGGIRSRPKKRATSAVSMPELREAADRILVARQVFDGYQWIDMTDEHRRVMRQFSRWTIDPSSEFPAR